MVSRPSKDVMPWIAGFLEMLEVPFLHVFATFTGVNDAPRYTAFDLRYPGKVFMFWVRFKKHKDDEPSLLKTACLDQDCIVPVEIKFIGHRNTDPLIQINEFEMRWSEGGETLCGIIDKLYENAY